MGVLTPDNQLEDYVREAANLPERLEEDTPGVPGNGAAGRARGQRNQQPQSQSRGSGTVDPDGEEEDPDKVTEEDMQAVEEAKKRLGRSP